MIPPRFHYRSLPSLPPDYWQRLVNALNRSGLTRYMFLSLAIVLLCVLITPDTAHPSPASNLTMLEQHLDNPFNSEQQGQSLYDQGRFAEAIEVFQQTAQRYQQAGDRLGQATVLSNLALTYQRLGNWTAANATIAQSLELLHAAPSDSTVNTVSILAQTLNIQGFLQLEQGQAEAALETWAQATTYYTQLNNADGLLNSQINQASALQALGFYRRAIDLLAPLQQSLSLQPDSLLKLRGLRNFGDALQVAGDLNQAQTVLQESLTVAEHLQQPDAISGAQLSLGNVSQTQGDTTTALVWYERAIATAVSPVPRSQALLKALQASVALYRWSQAQNLWRQIPAQLQALPLSHTRVYFQVNLAYSLMQWRDQTAPSVSDIATILTSAIGSAQTLGDRQAESYALGTLGTLYEQIQQWQDAQTLTERALLLSQDSNADHIAYLWQWQLGRLLNLQRTASLNPAQLRQRAIAAYSEAVKTLKSIRADLVAINPDVQFSFQQSIEPIYREFVQLLLSPSPDEPPNPANFEQARQVIESLQQAELENFFREACLDTQSVAIDQVDQQAAVLYPIILPDSLEVIVHLPQRPLLHYTIPVVQSDVEDTIQQVRQQITNRSEPSPSLNAQRLYNWLIRPVSSELEASQVTTLVFVLDGSLRNIPMSVLHDGNQFLLERYRLALTPGLQLLASQPLKSRQISILAAGLSDARQGFSALPQVENELAQIRAIVPATRLLLNQEFTDAAIQKDLTTTSSPIVHLATHGQFSSNLNQTFVLTWDDKLTIYKLKSLLQNATLNRQERVELLVLSACTTATGDRRAALGLAGMSVRAGARSTIASLWRVDDQSSSALMVRFYQELVQGGVTKAEALRRAQLSILNDPQYRGKPYYWAAFVLIGNWL